MTDAAADAQRIRDLERIQRARLGWGALTVLWVAWARDAHLGGDRRVGVPLPKAAEGTT
jgi:hypothetical protein